MDFELSGKLAIAAAAAAFLTATATSAMAQANATPVNIGVLTPLSPPGDSAAGQLIVRGAELGAKYVNQRLGGVWNSTCPAPGPVNIVKGDDSGLAEKGMAALRSLVTNDKIAGVLGTYDSTVALAVQPLAEQYKLPLLVTQASDDKISGNHTKFTFMTHTIARDRSDVVEAFIKSYGFKRVAILAENTDYGTSSGPDMQKRFVDGGMSSQLWIFDKTNPDLLPTLLQVKKFAPDVIYNMGVGAPAYLIVKQSADVGLLPKTPMIISYDLPIRPEFWRNLGELGKNMIFLSYYQPKQVLTDAGKWLQEEYRKSYNEPALYSSLAAFGNTIVLAQAMNAACSTEGEKVSGALVKGGFTSWNQTGVAFKQSDGVDWQRSVQPIMVLQYTKANQGFGDATILYPPNMKTGELVR
ncbi:ABC transporter substrate-binding protein [Bradyrhizobium mercantei]|uniref:ABC transporter substrate-binding protein n=1 Tax=Bradyrhizobium mercantei TaxID=1904807 RepID=UPI0009756B54|nr:ABC transporter substrate-binding protein [Bradyrhizobium mercantei]